MKEKEYLDIKDAFFNQATEVFSHIWISHTVSELAKGESPPEKMLGLALGTILWDEILKGRVKLKNNIPIEGNNITEVYYRPDFVLSQSQSKGKLVIECDGYNYHDRMKANFEKDRKRERELQREGYRVYRFTADEIFTNPWRCALDVIEAINGWPEFNKIILSKELLSEVQSLMKQVNKDDFDLEGKIEQEFSQIKESIKGFSGKYRIKNINDPRLVILRSKYPRAQDRWSREEKELLRNAFKLCDNVIKLAELFQRHPGSIRSRLRKMKIVH